MANKVILAGNVGQDPEMMTGGACRFTLATNESYKDKEGNKVDATEWHNCVVFGKSAEIILKYVTKGSKLFIDGKLKTTMYEKNGEKRYSTSIVVNQFEFMDSIVFFENADRFLCYDLGIPKLA